MSSSHQDLDSNKHPLGCLLFGEMPAADPDSGQIDLYCDCHTWTEPAILANGTDIAWPAGWTEEQALVWRARNGLAAPTPI